MGGRMIAVQSPSGDKFRGVGRIAVTSWTGVGLNGRLRGARNTRNRLPRRLKEKPRMAQSVTLSVPLLPPRHPHCVDFFGQAQMPWLRTGVMKPVIGSDPGCQNRRSRCRYELVSFISFA